MKAGYVIGNHAAPGKDMGTAFREANTLKDYPFSSTKDDDTKLEINRTVPKTSKVSGMLLGRQEAIGAYILADRRPARGKTRRG